ncbi:hypothetical protein [Reyranella sp.]|uniref:hypothetical protein n=1 Tax=Reyranella sp. TaxID=1929291 RepID=UPI003BA852CA
MSKQSVRWKMMLWDVFTRWALIGAAFSVVMYGASLFLSPPLDIKFRKAAYIAMISSMGLGIFFSIVFFIRTREK